MRFRHAPSIAFVVGFLMFGIGLWLERPSLALIVIGGLMAAAVAWTYTRGGYPI